MKTVQLVLLLASLTLSACTGPTDPSIVGINTDYLCRHWLHSYEEPNSKGGDLYRPEGSREFPASRFRMQYIFNSDGTCRWYYLDPADAHHFKDGTWTIDKNAKDVIHINQDGMIVSYRLLELSPNILRMTQIP